MKDYVDLTARQIEHKVIGCKLFAFLLGVEATLGFISLTNFIFQEEFVDDYSNLELRPDDLEKLRKEASEKISKKQRSL